MKISDYKLRKFDPESRDEIITTVEFSHYGFKCKGKLYTCSGELEENYIVSAKMKFIGTFRFKNGTMMTITDYDSSVTEINEQTVKEFLEFCAKYYYQRYKDGK